MTAPAPGSLERYVAHARARAAVFRADHGAVVVSVTTGNILARAGIAALRLDDGYEVRIDPDADDVIFMDVTDADRPDVPMSDRLLHFHLPYTDDLEDGTW